MTQIIKNYHHNESFLSDIGYGPIITKKAIRTIQKIYVVMFPISRTRLTIIHRSNAVNKNTTTLPNIIEENNILARVFGAVLYDTTTPNNQCFAGFGQLVLSEKAPI